MSTVTGLCIEIGPGEMFKSGLLAVVLFLCSPGPLRLFFSWIIFMNYFACTFLRVFEHPSFPVLIEQQKLERRHKCTDMQVIKRNPKRHTHTHVNSSQLTETNTNLTHTHTQRTSSKPCPAGAGLESWPFTHCRWNCPPRR